MRADPACTNHVGLERAYISYLTLASLMHYHKINHNTFRSISVLLADVKTMRRTVSKLPLHAWLHIRTYTWRENHWSQCGQSEIFRNL
jgi:hypothetical protein